MLREAQAMARLSHPNIVGVHEVGEIDGLVYVAMEFVVGRTLRTWLRDGPHPRSEVLDVMLQAAEGLAAAHAKGLVHRDFKPDNVMVDDEGRVRVMDFGLARASDEQGDTHDEISTLPETKVRSESGTALSTSLTQTGSLLGTPRYMAPEQFEGRVADARSDQFAFCLVLWEALYGQPCFKAGSVAALMVAVTEGERDPPPKEARVPGWLRTILDRGLQTKPAFRFETMLALMAALRADPTRRRRVLASVGALALVGVSVAGGYWVEQRQAKAHCRELGAEIDQDWNQNVRDEMRTAMIDTGSATARDSFTRVAARLDEYAASWSRAREDLCVAGRFENLGRDEHDASADCLRRRRHGLVGLVESLRGTPSNLAIEQATGGAAQLDPIAVCRDPRWLAQFPALPQDEDRRATIEQAQDLLSDADTAQAMAAYAEAIKLADEAAQLARDAEWISTEARAQRTAGLAMVKQGRHAEGADRLRQAASLATASGLSRVAVDAELALMGALVDFLQGYDEAARLSEVLGRTIPTLEPEPGLLALDWNFLNAKLYEVQGQLDPATRHYADALELAVEIYGANHPDVASIYMGQGSVALSRGDVEQAADQFAEAVEITQNVHGSKSPLVSGPLTNLAIAERELGRYVEARQHLDQAIEIDSTHFGPTHLNVAFGLDALSGLLQVQGEFSQALEPGRRALEIFERELGAEHLNTTYSMANLARAELEAGEIDQACARYERALTTREKILGADNPILVSAIEGLARCALERDDPAQAVRHYERAVQLVADARGENDPQIRSLREALATAVVAASGSLESDSRKAAGSGLR